MVGLVYRSKGPEFDPLLGAALFHESVLKRPSYERATLIVLEKFMPIYENGCISKLSWAQICIEWTLKSLPKAS